MAESSSQILLQSNDWQTLCLPNKRPQATDGSLDQKRRHQPAPENDRVGQALSPAGILVLLIAATVVLLLYRACESAAFFFAGYSEIELLRLVCGA